MTTFKDRCNRAVVIVDVQTGVVADAFERNAVVHKIDELVGKARRQQVPVVWVQHNSEELKQGSAAWQIVPELSPRESEPVVEKEYGDAFENTELESILAELNVGHMFVAGAQTDACVRATIHGGFARGYDVTLVSDAHTTQDLSEWGAPAPEQVIAHTNLYWAHQTAPGREANVVTTAEVDL